MSANAFPITSQHFAAALESLPISSLHAKISELENSISHLARSNKELEDFAREGDKDCYEAMLENREVIKRFEERIELVKREITEVRGLPLQPQKETQTEPGEAPRQNGVGHVDMGGVENERPVQQNGTSGSGPAAGAQQNGTSRQEDGEEGVFL